jgi:hypothetical protein
LVTSVVDDIAAALHAAGHAEESAAE